MAHGPRGKPLSARHPILVGMVAGLVAGAAAEACDKVLDPLVSERQKRRDRLVRKAPAHKLAGPHFAAKLLGRRLTPAEQKRARGAFGVLYGLGWGALHSGFRRRFPGLGRWGGLTFAVPFFLACDGVLAPGLGVAPRLDRIPWQQNLKEMGNHIAWSAAAELVHRLAASR